MLLKGAGGGGWGWCSPLHASHGSACVVSCESVAIQRITCLERSLFDL